MALEGGNGVKGTGLAGAFARGRKGGFPAGYDVRKDKEVDPMSEEVATYINENIESGGGGDVSSVFGRDGAVTAQTGDYSVDQVTGAQAVSEKGQADGYASLDGDGLVPESQIPAIESPVDSVNGKTGTVILFTDDVSEGTTNKYTTEESVSSVGAQMTDEKGLANGYPELDSGGKVPESQLPASTGSVSSVFTRSGDVVAESGDYNSDQVTEGSTNKYASDVNIAAAGAVMDSDFAESEGFMRKLSSGTYAVVKTNLTATTDPGVSDDSATGYGVGSRWVNATLETEWVCIDSSTGAAVWKRTTEGTIFDKTWSTGSIASSGSYQYNLSTGADLLSCTFQATQFTVTSGSSESVTIGIYDGDPSAGGVIRYEVSLYDISSNSVDDRNVWWMAVSTAGDMWLKIENFASTDVTLSVRMRIKGD